MKIKDQLVKLFSSPVLTLTCRLVPEASNFINSVSRSCFAYKINIKSITKLEE